VEADIKTKIILAMLEEHTQAMKMTAILSLTTHVTIGLLINKRLRIPKGQSKNGQSREITT
jgi:hypothetical protein